MRIRFKTVALGAAVMALLAASPCLADRTRTYAGVPAGPATTVRAVVTIAGSGLTRSMVIEERAPGKTEPIRSFDVDMQRRMHLIVVSDDLERFMHIHPVLGSDGRFRIDASFPGAGVYHVYADAEPATFGHAVFRFDIPIDAAAATPAPRHLSPIGVAALGDYVVHLSADRVKAGADTPVLVSIMKAGEPASDLHPYLGAYAHIVAIDARDLSYTHVHAMDMSAMASGAAMNGEVPPNAIVPATMPVHLTLPHRGIYKVWVQFIGGSRLYAAPFVISAT